MFKRILHAAILAALLPLVAGCASEVRQPPRELTLTIDAAPTLNVDAKGRSTPVVMRIYELQARDAFGRATFFELYDHDGRTLGKAALARAELIVHPGEQLRVNRPLDPMTRVVAVMAAYQNIDAAKWRASIDIPAAGPTYLRATLDASTIALARADVPEEHAHQGLLMRWIKPAWTLLKGALGK
ncbi:type VI secretion system lipoprotein TssJ [Trinickia sp. LjRoot230]|uniref:type VI secretion system lipoprotein TssJ n=1 Tax=Trinickia sp. LjRoot230 TaxID=3342288 RepID=UPI003ECC7C99